MHFFEFEKLGGSSTIRSKRSPARTASPQKSQHIRPHCRWRRRSKPFNSKLRHCPVLIKCWKDPHLPIARPTRRSVRRETPGVGEEVEEAPSRSPLAYHGSGDPMVEKQPGIEIALQVDDKAQPAFVNDELFRPRARFFILRRPALALPLFQRNRLWRQFENLALTRTTFSNQAACSASDCTQPVSTS